MPEFHHPYNFVRATGRIEQSGSEVDAQKSRPRIQWDSVAHGTTGHPVRHDLWIPNTCSGRVITRVTLRTPTLVGGAQELRPDGTTLVRHFKRDDKPAIPGSTLRGMVGSIAEAISQSSLRVLDNRDLEVRDPVLRKRKPVNGTVWEFFSAIDRDLVPWNPDRVADLTPAECLFGVVEECKDKEGNKKVSIENRNPARKQNGRNLASRLRFFDALPSFLPSGFDLRTHEANRAVVFKVLNSSKPPCPSMYFHSRGAPLGDYVRKSDLSKTDHDPNGRKFYLHHWRDLSKAEASHWQHHGVPERPEMHLAGAPLPVGCEFLFHIDFDNLSNAELTLLLTSLRPSEGFRHRLGLGKPLGLGSVELDIEGVFFIDRQTRYGVGGLSTSRYAHVWRPRPVDADANLGKRYDRELQGLQDPTDLIIQADFTCRDPCLIDDFSLSQLKTLGDPQYLKEGVKVGQPLTHEQWNTNAESDTYEWFVSNDDVKTQGSGQHLKPVIPYNTLPSLMTLPKK